ncbi:MAG: ATP-dependent DNA helicase RecG [Acidobacteriota bacterium]
MSPTSDLEGLPGIGPKRAAELRSLGIRQPLDLLLRLPQRWEDRRSVAAVADLTGRWNEGAGEELATVVGYLESVRTIRLRGRRTMVTARLRDAADKTLDVRWFNRPFIARQIDPAARYRLHGAVKVKKNGLELLNPSCERWEVAEGEPALTPIYSSLGPHGPATVRRWTEAALRQDLPADPLPADLRSRRQLGDLPAALRAVHQPPPDASLDDLAPGSPPWRRVAYQRLLERQLRLARRRSLRRGTCAPISLPTDPDRLDRLARPFPFELTAGQRRCGEEILSDLGRSWPMDRLLQGDVGSGKTAVAALALGAVLEAGGQALLMAPTELLAEQHRQSLDGWGFGERWKVATLTASRRDAEAVRRELADGSVDLVVGTHSLIQHTTRFVRLALVVIDEQQRFGVEQRQAFAGHPHRLTLTATPIPRSLALTLWGDLELSILDEKPRGRQPVVTELQPITERMAVYAELEKRLERGEQAFVVMPRVGGEDKAGATAAVEVEGEALRERFAKFGAAAIHGGTPSEERQAATAALAAGDLRLVVATTVIEVGVDVPGATRMVVENAECFGLAQLHQLRGRIGRSTKPSKCILLHGPCGPAALRRLEQLVHGDDGFRLAAVDLRLRGAGDLLGARQSGLEEFSGLEEWLAEESSPWPEYARKDAEELLARWQDPALAALRERLAGDG